MTEPQHRTVESRGLTLHYLEWGQPNNTPLVLVHGFLDQAYSWTPLVAEMQKRAAAPLWVIAPDCRGHGDSGWVGHGGYYHFPDYVFDLACVLRDRAIDRFKLIGHSMGGTISFLFTGTFPRRVEKLVLIEGVGPVGMTFEEAPTRMGQWINEVLQRDRNHFRAYSSLEAGAHQLRQTNPRLSEALSLELARNGMKPTAEGKWIWKFDPLHRTAAPQPFYTNQALQFLRRITCPTLIVEGKESRQTRRTDKQDRYNAITDHRCMIVDNAGHMVHQDNPPQLAEIIEAFFS